jgi:hypothetical protein
MNLGPCVVNWKSYRFDVLELNGGYVLCGVTGTKILINDVLYWSMEFQEAYLSASEATQRYLEHHPRSPA